MNINTFGEIVVPIFRCRHEQVHIVTQRCNGQASCNCGVGVRSGDTVLFIDRCRKKSLIEKMKCKNKYDCKNLMKVSLMAHDRITPGTRMFSRNSGKEFTVSVADH
jgi:hypothetical protein